MRLRFSDTSNLARKAKNNYEKGIAGLKKWWSSKYRLPPNHPLFQDQTFAELTLEMYEDSLLRKDELLEEVKFASGARLNELHRQLQIIDEMLGLKDEKRKVIVDDPLVDKWERELEQGITPDLDETM